MKLWLMFKFIKIRRKIVKPFDRFHIWLRWHILSRWHKGKEGLSKKLYKWAERLQ